MMAEDEDYWNQSSITSTFNFDDGVQESNEEVLRLFGVSTAPKTQLDVQNTQDLEVRSTHSDDSRSTRSDTPSEELSKKQPVENKKPITVVRRGSLRSTQSAVQIPIAQNAAVTSHIASSPSLSESSKISASQIIIPPHDGVIRSYPNSDASQTHLFAEIQYLRRSLEASRKDQWVKISPKDMVWRIVRKKPYGLENYRGLEEKVALLDQALNLFDSDAIVITVLHMKNSLCPALFRQEMTKKPDAVDQYVSFLMTDNRMHDCADLLESLGRTEEAAMFRLKIALHSEAVDTKLRELDTCIKSHPSVANLRESSDLQYLRAFKSLLEIQRPIDKNDEKTARDCKSDIFLLHPRSSIIGFSLLQTLHYCCFYHYDTPETSFWSPTYIKKTYSITEKQFLWTAISALSRMESWNEIQALLTDRTGWFGVPKPKSAIGFDKVTDILVRNSTPPDVLAYYLRLIEEPETRLQFALKSKCHSVSIDTMFALKDFDKLREYISKLDPASQEHEYGQEVLRRIG